MGEHKRQGKTFFVTVDKRNQLAIHRSPSGHFTRIRYCDGGTNEQSRAHFAGRSSHDNGLDAAGTAGKIQT